MFMLRRFLVPRHCHLPRLRTAQAQLVFASLLQHVPVPDLLCILLGPTRRLKMLQLCLSLTSKFGLTSCFIFVFEPLRVILELKGGCW
jgi:hypothetical protein